MGGRQVNKKQNPLLTNQPPPPDEGQKENPLAKFFKQKEKTYVPVTQSLEEAGVESIIMDMNIDDKIVECLVIPLQELIYKEWRHMTKSELVTKPQNERNQDDPGPVGFIDAEGQYKQLNDGSPEMGGPGDVQSGTDQPECGPPSPTPELQQ